MVKWLSSLRGWTSRAGVLFLCLACASDAPAPRAQTAAPDTGGCPATLAALPASPFLQDSRLQGDKVIVVFKEDRRLGLYSGGALERNGEAPACWKVALGVTNFGTSPEGPKVRQGDRKTPEGWYRTSDKPSSQFYAAIAVHYPNAQDADRGVRDGIITKSQRDSIVAALERGEKPNQNTALGGEILIHGGGSFTDWTLGCVALDDADIDALRALLPKGMRTNVLILP